MINYDLHMNYIHRFFSLYIYISLVAPILLQRKWEAQVTEHDNSYSLPLKFLHIK